MIFPNLELETTVQQNDKTRLSATKTFISPDEAAITLIEIQPESAESFITVTSPYNLDWSYSTTPEAKTITVRVTTDGAPVSLTKTLTIVDSATDKLFSGDAELVAHEPSILDWVRPGRNSFLDVHRLSQDRIMTWLDENKFWDKNDDPLTLAAVINISEFNDWSKFMTLKFIFEGLSNSIDDVFHEKAVRYREMELTARQRAVLRVDTDGDLDADNEEAHDLRGIEMLKV